MVDIRISRPSRLVAIIVLAAFLPMNIVWAADLQIPANTRVYVTTNETLIGKKNRIQQNQNVNAQIWRDVIVNGVTIIKAGTPVLVRVDEFKRARIAGRKGKIVLGAYETTAIDGSPVQLGGGYYKEGKGRIALTAALAGIVFLPFIFIKGKRAELPQGTVFDAYINQSVSIAVEDGRKPVRAINLSGYVEESPMSVELLYDELTQTNKPKDLPFSIKAPTGSGGNFVIDRVNGAPIESIAMTASKLTGDDTSEDWKAQAPIKDLFKTFKKGLNTIEIATEINGERVAEEVIVEIQI